MPLFEYYALDAQGKKHHGILECINPSDAKNVLRARGLMVTQVSLKTKAASKGHLSNETLLTFTLQLSQLINAGIPLYESLVAIEEQYQKESFHRILLNLCDQVKAGTPLSEAMKQYPESFDRLYYSMIAAGEAAGALGLILKRLTQFLTTQMKLKGEIKTAMIYPAILAGFAFLMIIVQLVFLIPMIEGIFQGRNLNWFTTLVLNISYVFRSYWYIYVPILVTAIGWSYFKLRTQAGKLWVQRTSLKLPLIRTLVIQTSISRFARTMATLQEGGLPIIDSLQLSRAVMRNVVLEKEIEKAESKIVEGSSLSDELKNSEYIPPLVTRMIGVGEDTGSTTVMFEKIADMYEAELEKSLASVVALAQPAILIFMGGIIGLVMIAIFIPLTQISSLVGA